jgi:arylsulfatase A-like enzyme
LSDRLISRAASFILEHSQISSQQKKEEEEEEDVKKNPFFLYLSLIHTHVPHHPSAKFMQQAHDKVVEFHHRQNEDADDHISQHSSTVNKTAFYLNRLVYNAVLLEADDMVRRVFMSLENAGREVADNTFTIITSDNGPWLKQVRA